MALRFDVAVRALLVLVLITGCVFDAQVALADAGDAPAALDGATLTPLEATYAEVATSAGASAGDTRIVKTAIRSSWLCQEKPKGCPCPKSCLRTPAFRIPCFDDCIDKWRKFNKEQCLRVELGGYHWVNVDADTSDVTYGFPNSEGTYFFFAKVDLECKTCSSCFPVVGIHMEGRWRERTKFRSYFANQAWFYELYGYVGIGQNGKLKLGSILKRFGIKWRGSFWGNSEYFDGWKTDTDYGISWEHVWNKGRRFEVPTFVQLFFAENRVSGALAGGDAESSSLYKEGLTGVVRAVPTWHFDKRRSLEVGVSGILGSIPATAAAPTGDQTLSGYAVDFTLKWCDFSIYGEWGETFGTVNERHYITRGPSDQYSHASIGVHYDYGPFRLYGQYSHATYQNPGGSGDIYMVGLMTRLTSYTNLYIEYVDWPVTRALAADATLERGWQFVVKWWI